MSNTVSATRIVKAMNEAIKDNSLSERQENAFRYSVFSLVADLLPNYIGEFLIVSVGESPDSLRHTWRGSGEMITVFHDEVIAEISNLALAAKSITPNDYEEVFDEYDE